MYPKLQFSFTDWWKQKVEPYLDKIGDNNPRGRHRLVQNSVEFYMNIFPDGINMPNSELTNLARKAAGKLSL